MKVGIIGGGAAGLAAAAFCGGDTAIVERNEKVGKKLYITGKGRCNLTNNCALYEFFPNIVRGEKFMISSLTAFPPQALMEFMGENGLRLKTERGGRVFPASDKSSDVIKTLLRAAESRGAKILLDTRVLGVTKDGGGFAVHTDKGDLRFDRLIVATGGLGYPSTGSTGDGYEIARSFGHSIVPAVPGLAPLLLKDDVSPLRGLSLRNVRATVTAGGKSVSEFGEMLFTDDGVSGPIILTLVSRTNRLPLAGAKLSVDLKPALSPDTLDDRLTSDLGEMRNKDIANILTMLMPKALIPYVLERSGVPPHVKGNSVTRAQRYAVGFCVKNLTFTIERADDVKKAIITSGGVDLKEVDPRTMESKLVPGLYFAGEVLDVDALTGGYNLQCAFATGRSAGIAAGSK
mgnify:CR=1 FL=1